MCHNIILHVGFLWHTTINHFLKLPDNFNTPFHLLGDAYCFDNIPFLEYFADFSNIGRRCGVYLLYHLEKMLIRESVVSELSEFIKHLFVFIYLRNRCDFLDVAMKYLFFSIW